MENPPALLPTENYEAIEAAVMETARGRWFLAEYARRNRQADTRAILDAIDELSRQVDNHPVGSGELELLRRINALAGFATRSRAALTIEVQGRETPLLRVALSMLAEIERKLQVLGGQEAEAEADFLSASEPTPRRAEAVVQLVPNDAAEDELFAEPPVAPPDVQAVAPEPEPAPVAGPEDIAATLPDGATESDFDLFVSEDEEAVALTEPESLAEDAVPAAQAETLTPEAEAEPEISADEVLAEIDALAAIATEPLTAQPDPEEEMAPGTIEAVEDTSGDAQRPAATADSPSGDADEGEGFTSPPIARTIQEIDGEPRWVFARKPAPVPRIAEIDALSFEEKSVYFA